MLVARICANVSQDWLRWEKDVLLVLRIRSIRIMLESVLDRSLIEVL